MINTILSSFKIDITYKINAFIYMLKKTPLIKYFFPTSLYSLSGFKSLIRFIIISFITIFEIAKKILYIALLYFISTSVGSNTTLNFTVIYLLLSFMGMFNISTLKANSKKYYSVILMNIDAKKYDISHNTLNICSTYILHTIGLLIFMSVLHMPLWYAPILSLFNSTTKIIGNSLDVKVYLKNNYILSQSFKVSMISFLVICALTTSIIYFNIHISIYVILACTILLLIISIFCARYLFNLDKYKQIYKKNVTPNKFIFDADSNSATVKYTQKILDSADTTLNENIKSKNGYDYLNAIFFKRHKKILLNSAKNYTLFLLAVFVAVLFGSLLYKDFSANVNKIIMTSLPYFIFVMYFVNRGANVTQAMFFNCDHSMLTYKFYRKPKVILSLFRKRLFTLVGINLLPSLVIAIGLPILLLLTGGTTNILIYIGIFLSIVFLNIFFSVHYLVLYYLLQPYDINMKQKSGLYSIVSSLTYILCFTFMKTQIDTTIFCILSIIATGVYIILALISVYLFAPKTFKLK